ncbi:MAG: hydroxymethylpyrimidine/phosphomethylpyrimidine kinase, partial [Sideroxyarcus sp.]|nr:hydroxymethylpyrimidine/phosphomethylpyrimidine kinase [Sideroxyarcus sp.]
HPVCHPSLREGSHTTPAHVLANILSTHEHDTLPDAIKIGMIGTLANLDVICEFLERHPHIPVVLDPVLCATSGLPLLDADAYPMLKERLCPRATVLTPNLDEVGILLGYRPTTVSEMESAARALQRGTQVVVVKGGHLTGDPVDVVWDGKMMQYLSAPRVASPRLRGTGCRLASAMAAEIAQGQDVIAAITHAKNFLIQTMNISISLKTNKKDQGVKAPGA